jgi:hypothetical protein
MGLPIVHGCPFAVNGFRLLNRRQQRQRRGKGPEACGFVAFVPYGDGLRPQDFLINTENRPHLVIISPLAELTTIPSVYGFVRHLESRKIPVTLFVPGSPIVAMGSVASERIHIWGQYPNWHPHGAWRLVSTESYIRLFALRQKLRRGWSAMIALNGLGLGNAQLLNRWLGLPIWYWSLDIPFDDQLADGTSSFCRWRHMEKQFLPFCAGGIIQDQNKSDAFTAENPSFQDKPMLLLPNSSLGRAVSVGGCSTSFSICPKTRKSPCTRGRFPLPTW